MQIGLVPSPREWDLWPEAEALLDPARKLGDFDTVLDDRELLWAVMDSGELLACATTRMTTDKHWEVILVGGHDYRRWVGELDNILGRAARDAGADRMLAMGRAGWRRALEALGWDRMGVVDGMTVYTREV